MEGYIKLHRKILENGIFRKPKVSHLFNYCLLRANWSDKTIIWNGQSLVVERGSFITGRRQIALETGLSEQNVRYALRTLHTFGMVKPSNEKSTSKFTYLTVCNYNDYQHLEDEGNQQSNQQVTSNQPASNQQVTTDKNNNNNNTKETNKNLKEIQKKDDLVIPEWLDIKVWDDYLEHRKTNKKKMTTRAMELMIEKLDRARSDGHNPNNILEESICSGWQGIVIPDKPKFIPKPSIEPDRSAPIEKSFRSQRGLLKQELAQMNKQQAQELWKNLPQYLRDVDKIQQMFAEKN
jgi:DNA-binding transcriptional regulator GbsR (MarR family)